MRQPHMLRAGFMLASLGLTIAPIQAFGQDRQPEHAPAQPASDGLEPIIARLDSADVQIRTEATDRIRSDRAINLKMIEALLRTDKLSPEQRQRLDAVAFLKFREGPHAAMGIRNDQMNAVRGVTVAFLQPGFPSGQVLRLNDRIVAAAGLPIDTWEKLRAVIVSRDPGDEIPISVVRDGATLNLTVKLSEYGRLNQSGTIEPAILEMAWDLRSGGFKPPREPLPAIISTLGPADWLRPEINLDEIPAADYSGGDSARTGLVAGGEPRGGKPPRINATTLTRNFNNRGAPGGPFVIPRQPAVDAAQLQLQLQIQQFERFQQQRESFAVELESNNRKLADASLPESERAKLRSQNTNLVNGIRILEMQMQTIQATIKQLQQQR